MGYSILISPHSNIQHAYFPHSLSLLNPANCSSYAIIITTLFVHFLHSNLFHLSFSHILFIAMYRNAIMSGNSLKMMSLHHFAFVISYHNNIFSLLLVRERVMQQTSSRFSSLTEHEFYIFSTPALCSLSPSSHFLSQVSRKRETRSGVGL